MSEPQADERAVYVADSVDEFVERTRLQQIMEARQRAGEALRSAELRRMEARQSNIPEWQVEQAAAEPARAAVESYVYEVERLYRGTEEGRRLWSDALLGELDVARAVSLGARQDIGDVVDIRMDGRPLEETLLPVEGVDGYLSLTDREVTLTHERELPRRGRPVEELTETVDLTTPVRLSREAYRATNKLLAESDLGVKVGVEDEQADWEPDYRDEKE